RWQREIGDGIPVVETCDIRPVLFGLCCPGRGHCRLHASNLAALGGRKDDLTVERLRERLVELALLTGHDGAIGQGDADRRHRRTAARWHAEGGPESEEPRPFTG